MYSIIIQTKRRHHEISVLKVWSKYVSQHYCVWRRRLDKVMIVTRLRIEASKLIGKSIEVVDVEMLPVIDLATSWHGIQKYI